MKQIEIDPSGFDRHPEKELALTEQIHAAGDLRLRQSQSRTHISEEKPSRDFEAFPRRHQGIDPSVAFMNERAQGARNLRVGLLDESVAAVVIRPKLPRYRKQAVAPAGSGYAVGAVIGAHHGQESIERKSLAEVQVSDRILRLIRFALEFGIEMFDFAFGIKPHPILDNLECNTLMRRAERNDLVDGFGCIAACFRVCALHGFTDEQSTHGVRDDVHHRLFSVLRLMRGKTLNGSR